MRVLFYVALSFGLIWRSLAQQPQQMSLQDCIAYALENSETLVTAKLENDIAVTQINEALADGLPRIDGAIGVTRNFEIQTSFIQDFVSPSVYGVLIQENLLPDGTAVPAPQTFPAAFGTNWTSNAGITARQLIFDGSYFVGLKAARTLKLLRQKEQVQTETEVIFNVSNAYYLVLVTRENLEFLGRNFATVDTLLNETSAMYESGFSEKIDVSRIKIQHNNLKTELRNNTELLVTAVNLLKFQMGMPIATPIVLSGDLENVTIETTEIDREGAFSRRPEYSVLQKNKDLLDLSIRNFQSQYVPNLYANFNFGWTAGTNSFGDLTTFDRNTWFRYSALGLNLSIPIFDGFSKKSNIQRDRIQVMQIEEGLDQLENNVSREIIDAEINLQNALREVESQRENMALSEEVYQVTRIKYQEGLGANLDVVEANTSFKEAQTNYLNALYSAIISQIELKKALGILHNN